MFSSLFESPFTSFTSDVRLSFAAVAIGMLAGTYDGWGVVGYDVSVLWNYWEGTLRQQCIPVCRYLTPLVGKARQVGLPVVRYGASS